MKGELLDTRGLIKDEYAHFRGMIIGNASLTRFWPEKCRLDKQYGQPKKRRLADGEDGDKPNEGAAEAEANEENGGKELPGPVEKTTHRDKLYVSKGIPLQFDYRSKYINSTAYILI